MPFFQFNMISEYLTFGIHDYALIPVMIRQSMICQPKGQASQIRAEQTIFRGFFLEPCLLIIEDFLLDRNLYKFGSF